MFKTPLLINLKDLFDDCSANATLPLLVPDFDRTIVAQSSMIAIHDYGVSFILKAY
jgi:hypothetical protein